MRPAAQDSKLSASSKLKRPTDTSPAPMEEITKRMKLTILDSETESGVTDKWIAYSKAVEEDITEEEEAAAAAGIESSAKMSSAKMSSAKMSSAKMSSDEGCAEKKPAEDQPTHEQPTEEKPVDMNSDQPHLEFTQTVKVLVGPDENEFVIHPVVMCGRSRWFQALLSENWRKRVPVDIIDHDAETFNEYLKFVHGLATMGEELSDDSEKNDERLKTLISTYALATYLLDDRAANAIIDVFTKLGRANPNGHLPSPAIVSAVCACCPENPPMYTFVSDLFVGYATPLDLDTYREEVPADFFFSIAKEWTTQINGARKLAEVTGGDTTIIEVRKCVSAGRYHRHDPELCPRETCHCWKPESSEMQEDDQDVGHVEDDEE